MYGEKHKIEYDCKKHRCSHDIHMHHHDQSNRDNQKKRQPEKDNLKKTTRKRQPEKDNQKKTTRKRQPETDSQKKDNQNIYRQQKKTARKRQTKKRRSEGDQAIDALRRQWRRDETFRMSDGNKNVDALSMDSFQSRSELNR